MSNDDLPGMWERADFEFGATDAREADRDALRAEIKRLREALQAVRGLHFTHGRNIFGDRVCNECSPLQPMPCPTARALDAALYGAE